jgi:hypothetical protein
MATLDVTEILDDPMLTDTFTVRRRSLAVGENGRAGEGPPTEFPGVVGSIQYESASETRKEEGGQFSPRNLKIWTRFHLYKASDGYAPDHILWNGELYEILDVQSYANYGPGFYIGVAKSIKVMNQP